MKYLKWLLFVPVAAYPWLLVLIFTHCSSEQTVGLCALAFAVALTAALAVFFTRNNWTVKELSLAALAVRLLHIFPCLYLLTSVGFLSLLPYWTSQAEPSNMRNLVFLLECLALLLMVVGLILYSLFSGLPASLTGLAAVLRCRKEDRLTSTQAVVYGISQFVFLADVVCAILLCRATFKKEDF